MSLSGCEHVSICRRKLEESALDVLINHPSNRFSCWFKSRSKNKYFVGKTSDHIPPQYSASSASPDPPAYTCSLLTCPTCSSSLLTLSLFTPFSVEHRWFSRHYQASSCSLSSRSSSAHPVRPVSCLPFSMKYFSAHLNTRNCFIIDKKG